ncbi:ABC transporter ATP-binding protein [Paracraurococcus ruber]|uniref:Peptide ABC transporter ATP-binding protein n=1 Tax=Paracraurococcus ruber TaxID=77675 RepID=A0ABS1CRG6_9PROT|nr:oligopeptide/dipeptide ABC transporter ATP-binding protein [Paracraurococcus ruber]MBK1657024.1 peptide ABC transporter ATP-binding protein [Paracraurococcus ruber]TDG34280.1 ATP-binding cassette domain-containing protein [Paracraurococcus ruber]
MTALVQAQGLARSFGGGWLHRPPVQALRGVDLTVARGEALGVVGESGSGKSTLGRLLLGLLPPSAGTVRFDGQDVGAASRAEWRRLRQRMQIVFQDPFGSLDPRRRVGPQILDGIAIHGLMPPAERGDRLAALLAQVGLDPAHAVRFPHEFSGGQRQRIGIARALATGPEFLVADEPVSALDVSIQAQVMALLADLRRQLGLALLFISHDLPVVRQLCDRVVVLYLGRVMEEGPAEAVFRAPAHPYTRALLSATPRLDPRRRLPRIPLPGEPPSPANPPSGCVFRTRCPQAAADCAAAVPALQPVGAAHRVACLRAAEAA